jgi:hypothetical protein
MIALFSSRNCNPHFAFIGLGLKSIAMRASLLIIVALAVIAGVSFWRSTATGVSKTYGLSVALKDGICTADQETGADGVSPFAIPAALDEAAAKFGEPTEQPSYDCLGVAIPIEKKDYVGDWAAAGHVLSIASSGKVHYVAHEVRNDGGTNVAHTDTFDLPVQKFAGDDFLIGAMSWSMTFHVTRPPHLEDKIWRMTLDGVTYSHS